ncbi:MAG: hypothetical protein JXB49_31210 [Bacteroidales bacterium]|nr:hypothetical protein [Bacteroidales bacterium]
MKKQISKKAAIITTIICIIFCKNASVLGQDDSTLVDENQITQNYIQKKKYLNMRMVEETRLIKLGISPFTYDVLGDGLIGALGFDLSYEAKLNPSFSIIVDNSFAFQKGGDFYKAFGCSSSVGTRFYYGSKKDIMNRTGNNNFHRNYFEVKAIGVISYSKSEWYLPALGSSGYFGPDPSTKQVREDLFFIPDIQLAWGIQRRLGKWGFIDAGPYIRYNFNEYVTPAYTYFDYGINIKFGLGYGFNKK